MGETAVATPFRLGASPEEILAHIERGGTLQQLYDRFPTRWDTCDTYGRTLAAHHASVGPDDQCDSCLKRPAEFAQGWLWHARIDGSKREASARAWFALASFFTSAASFALSGLPELHVQFRTNHGVCGRCARLRRWTRRLAVPLGLMKWLACIFAVALLPIALVMAGLLWAGEAGWPETVFFAACTVITWTVWLTARAIHPRLLAPAYLRRIVTAPFQCVQIRTHPLRPGVRLSFDLNGRLNTFTPEEPGASSEHPEASIAVK